MSDKGKDGTVIVIARHISGGGRIGPECRTCNEMRADLMNAHTEIARQENRIQELLASFRRLTAEMPYPEEQNSTGALLAEIGTLRARVAALESVVARMEFQQ